MQKKLVFTYILVMVITIILAVGLSWSRINAYFLQRVEDETKVEIAMLKKLLEETGIKEEAYQTFVDSNAQIAMTRITLIDADGTVLADSDKEASSMDNHANRGEVLGAMSGEPTSRIRYSNTLKTYLFYYATQVETSSFTGVLRVSVPIQTIEAITNDMLLIIFLGIFVGSLVAVGIGYLVTRKLMKPINELTRVATVISEGDYDEKIYINQKDQIGQLAEAFNTMTYRLRKNIWDLSQRNAELESILTSMGSGMVVINKEYEITLYNQKFIEVMNLSSDDLKGKLFYEVTRELKLFEVVEKAIKEEVALVDETQMEQEGKKKIIQMAATPIFEKKKNGRNLGILIIVTDVSKIRKLESIRRDFVSNVTHELKTPLTSIRGFVETLKNGAVKEEKTALHFLDIIDIETERLAVLIQDILSLSEIETMVDEQQTKVWDIKEIINETVDILPEHNQQVVVILEVEEALPMFECNRNRMKQLLINLMDNSLKYTEEGYVKVACFEKNGYLTMVVEDTGIGIEHKHLSRLFERFYRVDEGRSRKVGGTGLGLSIVKHIVELYNGTIDITSEVGVGTAITIRLPYSC